MEEIKLNVNGMVCGGCEKRVVNAVSTIEGVKEVIANYNEGTVVVKSDIKISEDIIKEKIEDIGFEVKENY
jgi:copper chaperone CopZ